MFERTHHRCVAQVLQALDGHLLASHGCLFGGGTAMALRFGEYRESVDIDFLVSHLPGYRGLRQLVTGQQGIAPLLRPGHALQQVREVRADQYGLRTLVRVDEAGNEALIKLEIVFEARITLAAPAPDDAVCGVPTLTPLDMAASKLLANSDRWADDAVHSRDLIDLAMMAPPKPLLRQAIAKAAEAYGDSVQADLHKAIAALRRRPGRLGQCLGALGMSVPAAVVWGKVRRLAAA